jgi:hypothetical protein
VPVSKLAWLESTAPGGARRAADHLISELHKRPCDRSSVGRSERVGPEGRDTQGSVGRRTARGHLPALTSRN